MHYLTGHAHIHRRTPDLPFLRLAAQGTKIGLFPSPQCQQRSVPLSVQSPLFGWLSVRELSVKVQMEESKKVDGDKWRSLHVCAHIHALLVNNVEAAHCALHTDWSIATQICERALNFFYLNELLPKPHMYSVFAHPGQKDAQRLNVVIWSSILLSSSHIILFPCMHSDATKQHIYKLLEDYLYVLFISLMSFLKIQQAVTLLTVTFNTHRLFWFYSIFLHIP